MSGEKPKKDVTEAVMGALDRTDEWEKQREEEEAERQDSRLESALRRAGERSSGLSRTADGPSPRWPGRPELSRSGR